MNRARHEIDAADALQAQPQKCHACEQIFAGTHCPKCNAERPAFTALKNITRQQQAEKNTADAAEDADIARIARACGAL